MDEERKNDLNRIRHYSEEQFDKLLITLSSGGLLLTIAFVENIVDLNRSESNLLLVSTWILFAVCLIIMLFSHRTALISVDLELVGKDKKSDKWDCITKVLNYLGMFLFMTGVITFIIFVLINF